LILCGTDTPARAQIEGKEKKVFAYDNKGSFGELALMYNCPRAATVVVSGALRPACA
jgi:hypothetical protein